MAAKHAREGILVLGAPRSGTTLLRRLLDAHPRVACPSETNVFTACGKFLRSEVTATGLEIGVLEGLAYAGFDRDVILDRLRELAFSFHREYAKQRGKPRWASKTAFDMFYLNEIETLCADHCLFVCIQRHGADVACSMHELCEKNGGYLRELHEYIIRFPLVLDAFAHAWVDLTTALHAFVGRHPANAILVKYEDLVADPDATMAQIMAFLGEEWDANWTRQALTSRDTVGLGDWKTYGREAVDDSSVGRWKKLPRQTIARLGAICNPLLERCGYELLPQVPPESPETARRRHQVGLLLQKLASTTASRKSPKPGTDSSSET